jgi:HD-GYP domain-containing protein (c-di-GMP phosphodiesterase class II)
MIREPKILLYELISALSEAVDLVSPSVADHHMKVAYIAYNLGLEKGLSGQELDELILAGALHDIGALSLSERLDFLNFEIDHPHKHAELGYQLLKEFEPLANVASIIRFHHVPWNSGKGNNFQGLEVSLYSHILHLADRISVLIDPQKEPLSQVQTIVSTIEAKEGILFVPELVEAFKALAQREYFWLEASSPSRSTLLFKGVLRTSITLDIHGLLSFARLFARIIDFRSRHTATHSSGVAAVAGRIAELIGFSEREVRDLKIAGYLHDLGKLSVPQEILDKEEPLTEDEFNIIKRHAFYTYSLLDQIESMDRINTWASYHHERLDGSGYPFHLTSSDFPLGSRIIAVADIFTALTEDRPYRAGMSDEKVLSILTDMAEENQLDPYLVELLKRYADSIGSIRRETQEAARKEYQAIV